jgi:integrase
LLPLVSTKEQAIKKHLTTASVENIKPPKQGSMEVFDLGYPGLALRVGHGGAKSFEIFYRTGGKLRRESLGRWPEISLAAARDAWRKTRESIAKGEEPQREGKSNATLFEKAIEEWLRRDQSNNKASSLYQVTRLVEYDLLPAWRGRAIDAINKKDVIALLDSICDRGAVVKSRRVYSALHRFFKWAVSREIVLTHPMSGLERPGSEQSREHVLSDAELAKVWKGAGKVRVYGDVVKLLALTGARLNEIAQLRWDEIKGDHILLGNGRTKTGIQHCIPLSKPAKALLDAMPHIGDYVFSLSGTKPLTSWSRAKADIDKATGVSDWRIHDLRRTCATGLQRLGVQLQVVEACLGHTSGSRGGIVGVYQRHDFAAEKRAALTAWAEHVIALVQR